MSTGSSDPARNTGGEGDGTTGRDPGQAAGRDPGGPSAAGGAGGASGRGAGRPESPAAGQPGSGGRNAADGKAAQTGGTGADQPKQNGGDAAPVEQPTPFTQQLGRITIVVLAALFGVFAVANSQRVDFSWVFGETLVRESATGEMTGGVPLIILLLTAFAIGAMVTLLVEQFVSRSRRARRADEKGQDGKRRSG